MTDLSTVPLAALMVEIARRELNAEIALRADRAFCAVQIAMHLEQVSIWETWGYTDEDSRHLAYHLNAAIGWASR